MGAAGGERVRQDAAVAGQRVDLRAGAHWHLRGGYAHQYYRIDALFSGNLGMANNATFLQGRRLRGQTYTNRADTLTFDAVGDYRIGGATVRLLLGAPLELVAPGHDLDTPPCALNVDLRAEFKYT